MRRYPKPQGPFICGMCGDTVTGKDLMWHTGLGGCWIHRKCYEEWKTSRPVKSDVNPSIYRGTQQ